MNKIAIFYHIGQFNHWRDVFNEQIRKIQASGLYDASQFIFCGINGDEALPTTLDKVIGVHNSNTVLEADTLKQLWSFSVNNPGYKVLYLHTKGVTWDNEIKPIATSWRRFMESYVIKQWEKCINILDTYDTCGVLLRDKAFYNTGKPDYICKDAVYYDGNFWWATTDYIAKLNPDYLYTDDTPWLRGKSELWIGTGDPKTFTMKNLDYINPYFCDYGDANEYC